MITGTRVLDTNTFMYKYKKKKLFWFKPRRGSVCTDNDRKRIRKKKKFFKHALYDVLHDNIESNTGHHTLGKRIRVGVQQVHVRQTTVSGVQQRCR